MTRGLDAARITGPRGDAIELRAQGFSPRNALWERLSDEVSAVPSQRRDAPLMWDETADAGCLSPLSIFERATLLATLSRGARWDASVEAFATPLGELSSGDTLWSLTPRAFAGRWTLTALRDDAPCARVELEVRTRRIDPASGWRALLDDLAQADLGLSAHDASSFDGAWSDEVRPARSAFESFILLRAIVEGPTLAHALRDIARDPITGLSSASRTVPVHRASRALPEELAARALTLDASAGSAREHAPSSTLDVPENRFVLHAIESFERAASALSTGPRALSSSARRAAASLADQLRLSRESLSRGPLRGVGTLGVAAPLGSASLQRRRGYRELLAAWSRMSSAPGPLRFGEADRAGLVDAPKLYERWCALEVASALGVDLDAASRVAAGGASTAVTVDGVSVTLSSQEPAGARSYSLAFRPDLTLTARGRRLHLDAKYQLDDDADADDAPRAAIAKMHAYRDAIDATWGAYALYPGEGARETRFDAPDGGGVGAVALRPGDTPRELRRAAVVALVRRFLSAG